MAKTREIRTEAIYADPNDPEAFGHAIVTILRYPTIARQLARFGSYRARATFTWNGIAQQLMGVLQDVGERRRSMSADWMLAESPSKDVPEREVEWVPASS